MTSLTNISFGSDPKRKTNSSPLGGSSGRHYSIRDGKSNGSASLRDPGPSNEQDLRKKLKIFQVPETSIEAIGAKLATKIFDEYAHILRCMYSTRFNGDPSTEGRIFSRR